MSHKLLTRSFSSVHFGSVPLESASSPFNIKLHLLKNVMSFFNGMKRNTGTCVAMDDKTGINGTMPFKYKNTLIRKVEDK